MQVCPTTEIRLPAVDGSRSLATKASISATPFRGTIASTKSNVTIDARGAGSVVDGSGGGTAVDVLVVVVVTVVVTGAGRGVVVDVATGTLGVLVQQPAPHVEPKHGPSRKSGRSSSPASRSPAALAKTLRRTRRGRRRRSDFSAMGPRSTRPPSSRRGL